jgi:hypothetical protein
MSLPTKTLVIENEVVRDCFCRPYNKEGKLVAVVGGDIYIGEENNYRPIRRYVTLDLEGLFRMQREIAEAIETIAKGGPVDNF